MQTSQLRKSFVVERQLGPFNCVHSPAVAALTALADHCSLSEAARNLEWVARAKRLAATSNKKPYFQQREAASSGVSVKAPQRDTQQQLVSTEHTHTHTHICTYMHHTHTHTHNGGLLSYS